LNEGLYVLDNMDDLIHFFLNERIHRGTRKGKKVHSKRGTKDPQPKNKKSKNKK
jgi:hypothetical protein